MKHPEGIRRFKRIALGALLAVPAFAARQPYDGIVASVDDQIIMLSELEELRMVSAEQQPGLNRVPADKQRREILERLIDDKVVLVKAKQDTTIKVSEKDIAPRVEDAISRYVEQQGGEKKFETLLKQTNGMTLAQFRARLSQQYLDQSYRQKLQFKYVGDHEPSNQQIHEFYERYKDSLPLQQNSLRLSHIQVKIKPGPALEKSAYQKADSLIKRLDNGEPFADLAKKFSDDYSGKEGGDIGYTKRGTLDPDYERAAFSLEAGDYTKVPVRSRFGYHIVKVTGKKDNEIRTSHILVRLIPEAKDSVRTVAFMDSLRAVSIKDKSFPALAGRFSEDKKTKDHGGSLGWFTRDKLDPRYLQAVDSLQVGGVSAPIVIGDSYHIFRLDGKAPERKMTVDEDWAEISQIARNYFLSQKLSAFVKKWRETVHIENRLAQFKNLPAAAEGFEDDGSGEAGPQPAPN
ncbi:MAG TPA: peptidylprolyl isomerase [Fibrobacteria bacterium]|nr:peptidylprolyl isomerase [Fibrobacteria bacterium]